MNYNNFLLTGKGKYEARILKSETNFKFKISI